MVEKENPQHDEIALKTRDEWRESLMYSTGQYDKNVLWVAAGGFIVASFLVDKIIPWREAMQLWIILCACVVFGAAILISLFSHYHAMQRETWCIEHYDDYANNNQSFWDKFSTWQPKMKRINLTQYILLMLGFVFLILFLTINMMNNKPPQQTNNPEPGTRGLPAIAPVKPQTGNNGSPQIGGKK